MNINQNFEGVGQPSPLDVGVNAFVRMFKPNIIFTEDMIRKYNIISVRTITGKQYVLDLKNDRVVYTDSGRNFGVCFQVHEDETERVHYATIWGKGSDGEREYGVKVFFIQNKQTGRLKDGEVYVTDVRVKGE